MSIFSEGVPKVYAESGQFSTRVRDATALDLADHLRRSSRFGAAKT
jgi:hypothetical protein